MCKEIMLHGPGLAGMQRAGGIRRFNITGLRNVVVHEVGTSHEIFGGKPKIFCELNSVSRAAEEFADGGFEVVNSPTTGGSLLDIEQRLHHLGSEVTELVVVGLRLNMLSLVAQKMPGRKVFWLGVGSPDNGRHHGLSPLATFGLMEHNIFFLDLCLFKKQIVKDDINPKALTAALPTFSCLCLVLYQADDAGKKYLARELKTFREKTKKCGGKLEVAKKDMGDRHIVDLRFNGPADEHQTLAGVLQACRRQLGTLAVNAIA